MESLRRINNLTLHSVTGKIDDSFIGIKIKNSMIDFYYPETYDISKEDDIINLRNDIFAILKTISLAKTFSESDDKIENKFSINGQFALMSYLWIINDYLTNGIYINREKTLKINQRGKINWKRTLNRQPIISNGNVIYNETVVEVRNNLDSIIVKAHKQCVKRSLEFIGWLYNLSPKIIETEPYSGPTKKIYIEFIKNELDKTFDDYKKTRLNHMLNVICGLEISENKDEFVYGVDKFHYIFERMINNIFGTEKNLKDFYPSANWYIKNNDIKNKFEKVKSSNLMPDTVLIDNNIAYILDSKYYRYGHTADHNDLPETTSIQKQITYAEYLEKNNKKTIKGIRSAFILPYNMNNNNFNTNEIIHYIGYSETEWKGNENGYESIYAFLIDTKHVINIWNKSNHSDDISKLIKMINDAIDERV